MTEESSAFATWGVLEILGRKRLAGKLSEQTIASQGFIRIDIPTAEGGFTTQFYGPSSIYAITPTSEDLARRFAVSHQPEPINRWELPEPTQRPHPVYTDDGDEERF